jgi:hypothetical protein
MLSTVTDIVIKRHEQPYSKGVNIPSEFAGSLATCEHMAQFTQRKQPQEKVLEGMKEMISLATPTALFNGAQDPCGLCRGIAEAQSSEHAVRECREAIKFIGIVISPAPLKRFIRQSKTAYRTLEIPGQSALGWHGPQQSQRNPRAAPWTALTPASRNLRRWYKGAMPGNSARNCRS